MNQYTDQLKLIFQKTQNEQVANEAFQYYIYSVILTQDDYLEIIKNPGNKDIARHCINKLVNPELLPVAILQELLKSFYPEVLNFFWPLFVNHEEVSYYDICKLSKDSNSYLVRELANQTINSPYYLTFDKLVNKEK
jgi:hypothetical protein